MATSVMFLRVGFLLVFALLPFSRAGIGGEINVPFPGFEKANLGKGFDPDSGKILGPCFASDVVTFRNPSLRIKFHSNSTIDQLNRKVFGHAAFGLNLGILAHSSSADILAKLARGRLSLSILAELDYHHGTATIRSRGVDWADLPAYCKQGFIKGFRTGAKLLVSMQLIAENEIEYNRIVRKITSSALWGLLKKSRTEIQEFIKDIRSSRVEIRIVPLGFTSPELAKLPNAAHCHAADLSECLDFVQEALNIMGPNGGFERAVRESVSTNKLFINSINVEIPAPSH